MIAENGTAAQAHRALLAICLLQSVVTCLGVGARSSQEDWGGGLQTEGVAALLDTSASESGADSSLSGGLNANEEAANTSRESVQESVIAASSLQAELKALQAEANNAAGRSLRKAELEAKEAQKEALEEREEAKGLERARHKLGALQQEDAQLKRLLHNAAKDRQGLRGKLHSVAAAAEEKERKHAKYEASLQEELRRTRAALQALQSSEAQENMKLRAAKLETVDAQAQDKTRNEALGSEIEDLKRRLQRANKFLHKERENRTQYDAEAETARARQKEMQDEVKSLRAQVASSEAARQQAEEVVRKEAATVSALEAKVKELRKANEKLSNHPDGSTALGSASGRQREERVMLLQHPQEDIEDERGGAHPDMMAAGSSNPFDVVGSDLSP